MMMVRVFTMPMTWSITLSVNSYLFKICVQLHSLKYDTTHVVIIAYHTPKFNGHTHNRWALNHILFHFKIFLSITKWIRLYNGGRHCPLCSHFFSTKHFSKILFGVYTKSCQAVFIMVPYCSVKNKEITEFVTTTGHLKNIFTRKLSFKPWQTVEHKNCVFYC